jgi:hypothetical protein
VLGRRQTEKEPRAQKEPSRHLSLGQFALRSAIFGGCMTVSGMLVVKYFSDQSEATLTTQGEGVRQEIVKQSEDLRVELKTLVEEAGEGLSADIDERIDEFVADINGEASPPNDAVAETWQSVQNLL